MRDTERKAKSRATRPRTPEMAAAEVGLAAGVLAEGAPAHLQSNVWRLLKPACDSAQEASDVEAYGMLWDSEWWPQRVPCPA